MRAIPALLVTLLVLVLVGWAYWPGQLGPVLLDDRSSVLVIGDLKQNPELDIVPRTFIFGGKAAPGYYMAKLIIKLINSVAEVIDSDPDVKGRLKVVFVPDYNVKNSRLIYPAADLSGRSGAVPSIRRFAIIQ